MCEQAARYCRDGVHKLLNKEQGKLRAQETRENREQPPPQPPQQPPNPAAVAGQDSESATAAQSGNSGAQPGGIDGLVRWIVTKMSDNKNIASREYASSKEDVAVAQEQFFAPEPRRGISVILDIFRRADKDDDGKLSLDEFQAFFSDGTLNEEELEKLFHTIDSDNTSNVDTKELCDYFAKHMGDYEGVLASLETLNLSILKAMDFTKKVYERGTNVEQFVTRFLLKESANQIQSLLSSVESAVDAIDEQHSQSGHLPAKVSPRIPERRNENTVPDYPPNNRVSPREAVRTINTASGAVEVRKEGLEAQINRLAELIGRLENKRLVGSAPEANRHRWHHQRILVADSSGDGGFPEEARRVLRGSEAVPEERLRSERLLSCDRGASAGRFILRRLRVLGRRGGVEETPPVRPQQSLSACEGGHAVPAGDRVLRSRASRLVQREQGLSTKIFRSTPRLLDAPRLLFQPALRPPPTL